MAVSEKISKRISEGLKKFQPIVELKRKKDVNESDTVLLITDILTELLGFDKYEDITTEHAVHGTYCDLALKIDGKLSLLIEVKAIGIELKEHHARQAVDYAAKEGLKWVLLSNAEVWKIYRVILSDSLQYRLVSEIKLSELNHRNIDDIERLYVLSKEAISKCSLDHCFSQWQATNKFMVGNLLYTEQILVAIKKQLKHIYPDTKVQTEEIKKVLLSEIIKRELLEGEDYEEAKRKIARVHKKREKELSKNIPKTIGQLSPSSVPLPLESKKDFGNN